MTNKTPKQIVAIGGAMGKSIPQSRALMSYVLNLVEHSSQPKVLQINTASGDKDAMGLFSYRTLAGMNCQPSELTFFERTPRHDRLRDLILSQDVVFVNGGNTRSMLAVWREHDVPKMLREAWENGVILTGGSAGGICWFDQCLTDSTAEEYTALDCLGFLPGSCCPHFDGEAGRKEIYHRMIVEETLLPGIAIDERVGVHYVGERIRRVITTSQRSGAYLVHARDGGIVQARLAKTILS